MIYRNNVELSKNLPSNIKVCLNTYKEALNDYALNDYKMRLNENSKNSYGDHCISFRNAYEARTQARENMSQSLKAALVFAKDIYNKSGNSEILNETINEFHYIVSNSVYNGSEAYECSFNYQLDKPSQTIEKMLRTEIDNQKSFVSIGLSNYIQNEQENLEAILI